MNAADPRGLSRTLFRFERDLASRDYRWALRIRVGLWAAALLGLIAIAMELTGLMGHRQEIERLNRSLNRLQAEQKSLREQLAQRDLKNVTPQTVSDLTKQVTFTNGLIDKKAFLWTGLLSDLEDVVPANISLTAILPSRSQTITLSGTALSLADVTRLLSKLEASPRFTDALLADQKDTKTGRVEFSLTVRYRPEAK